ncbi:MAG: metalloprotease [Thermoplasmata archaeon]
MYRYSKSITFSTRELRDLSVSVVVLALCFTIARFYGNWVALISVSWFLYLFLASFVAVITAFVFHELAHKYVANRYGYWAEYRASYFFLAIALACSLFLGFVFAAPGAVVIAGYLSRRENGIISIAGPITNYVVALVLLPPFLLHLFSGFLAYLIETVIFVNLFIAGFNLIPFGNLDGAKVLAWNWRIWLLALIAIGITFILAFFILS